MDFGPVFSGESILKTLALFSLPCQTRGHQLLEGDIHDPRFCHFGIYAKHLNNKLEGTGVVAGTVPMEAAYGWVLEADYILKSSPDLSIGARFTGIKYKAAGDSTTVSGNAAGVILNYAWTE